MTVLAAGSRANGGAARPAFGAAAALLALLLGLYAELRLGPLALGAGALLDALASGAGVEGAVLRHVRLPRALGALGVGAALGLSGALLQALTRNRLAAPGVLGITAGGQLAVTLGLVMGLAVSPVLAAFAGACVAAALTFTLAGGDGESPVRLALSGIAVSLVCAAAASVLLILHENATAAVFAWSSGTLAGIDWTALVRAAWPVGLALAVTAGLARWLAVLRLGDAEAAALGVPVALVRLAGVLAAALLAAGAVALAGAIAFAGLLAPNAAALLGYRRTPAFLAASALLGGLLVLWADVGVQALAAAAGLDLPAGLALALIGAPVLLALVAARPAAGGPGSAGPAGRRPRPLPAAAGLGLLCALLIAAGSRIGPADLGGEAAAALADDRLARGLTAAVCGALLATAGQVLQRVVGNPLAGPEILGLSQGAGLGAVAVVLAAPALGPWAVQLGALAGTGACLALLLAVGWRAGFAPMATTVAGLALALLLAALTAAAVLWADLQAAQAYIWLTGSTYARGWPHLLAALPYAAVALVVAAAARQLDLMALGDPLTAGLGERPARLRLAFLAAVALLVAGAVAVVGPVAFVGLLGPHVGRLLGGARSAPALLVGAVAGAALLAGADLAGRLVLAPRELPAGSVTALIGAPYFLLLLARSRAGTARP